MGFGELLLGAAGLAQLAALAVPWPAEYRALFERWAPAGHPLVTANLLHALAWQESHFNPRVISAPNTNGTRDYGLMQINGANLARLGLTPDTAVTDPQANIRAAVHLLLELEPHAGNVADLASMYNAGQDRTTGRARHRADGGYVNADYVNAVYGRWALVLVASFAPVKRREVVA